MAENSNIEWTDHTVNLWWGCTKVHAGCDNCYAEYFSDVRYKNRLWGEGVNRKRIKSAFPSLDKYQNQAYKSGSYAVVFVGSMMDIFEKSKPTQDGNTGDLRKELFSRIDKGNYNNLIFLLLTKRPSNINKMIPEHWKFKPINNVFFGCSPVDQPTYNNFRKHMEQVNGNKFYSIEPQIGRIKLDKYESVDWIIQGGESGHKKRPFELEWARSMHEQCHKLAIPYFFKQIDKVKKIPDDMLIRQTPLFEDCIF